VRTTGTVIAALLLLASCQDRQPANDSGIDNAAIALNEVQEQSEAPPPASPASGEDGGTPTPTVTTTSRIPPAFHGRWGLVPADCGPDTGAAKGLLTVTGDMLRFY
jgi:hypothetical protein